MSEPLHQPHTPPVASLTWIGASGGASVFAWIIAITTVALTYRQAVAVGIAACIIAATLTLVSVILSARYTVEASNSSDHAQIFADIQEGREQTLEENRQLLALMQKLEAKVDLLAQYLPKALEDEKWKGYTTAIDDVDGGDVIEFPRRA